MKIESEYTPCRIRRLNPSHLDRIHNLKLELRPMFSGWQTCCSIRIITEKLVTTRVHNMSTLDITDIQTIEFGQGRAFVALQVQFYLKSIYSLLVTKMDLYGECDNAHSRTVLPTVSSPNLTRRTH